MENYKALTANKITNFNGLSFDGNKAYVIGNNIASVMTQVKFKVDFSGLIFESIKPYSPIVSSADKKRLMETTQ